VEVICIQRACELKVRGGGRSDRGGIIKKLLAVLVLRDPFDKPRHGIVGDRRGDIGCLAAEAVESLLCMRGPSGWGRSCGDRRCQDRKESQQNEGEWLLLVVVAFSCSVHCCILILEIEQ